MDEYTDSTPIFFGKHKGTKLGTVPADYLLYLWDVSNKGTTMYDKKLSLYIKNNLEALKMQAIASKQHKRYEKY